MSGRRWLGYLLAVGGLALALGCGTLAFPLARASDSAPFLDGTPSARLAALIAANARPTLPPTQPAKIPAPTRTPDAIIEIVVMPSPTAQATATPQAPAAPPTAEPAPIIPPTQEVASVAPGPVGPSRIVIPAIGLDAPVEAVGWHLEERDGQTISVWDVPGYFAAGWLKSSAAFGVVGNTVVEGHHNIDGEVFRDLVNLEPGDSITLYAAELARAYAVAQKLLLPEKDQSLEVRQENAQYIAPTGDERLTLVTCWPYTNNTHRLIIIALPVSP
ncbi:MAG: sortase [Thermoflexales bacterium]|nr:sortase [Thermoflexales bacterium]